MIPYTGIRGAAKAAGGRGGPNSRAAEEGGSGVWTTQWNAHSEECFVPCGARTLPGNNKHGRDRRVIMAATVEPAHHGDRAACGVPGAVKAGRDGGAGAMGGRAR